VTSDSAARGEGTFVTSDSAVDHLGRLLLRLLLCLLLLRRRRRRRSLPRGDLVPVAVNPAAGASVLTVGAAKIKGCNRLVDPSYHHVVTICGIICKNL